MTDEIARLGDEVAETLALRPLPISIEHCIDEAAAHQEELKEGK